jgi:hypothetical protein
VKEAKEKRRKLGEKNRSGDGPRKERRKVVEVGSWESGRRKGWRSKKSREGKETKIFKLVCLGLRSQIRTQ